MSIDLQGLCFKEIRRLEALNNRLEAINKLLAEACQRIVDEYDACDGKISSAAIQQCEDAATAATKDSGAAS